jgi:heme O synthase-like polyprenyltransferase
LFNISINELYEGKIIKKNKKVRQIIIFYILVSFISMFVLPILGICAPTFIISGILCPVFGLVKLVASIFGYDIPQINIELFGYSFNPLISFLIAIILGSLLFMLGIIMWKILLRYIKYISDKKKKLYLDL